MLATTLMIACGTTLRPPATAGETAVVRLASDAGCPAIALDGGCLQGHIAPVAVEAMKAGLQTVAVFAPMGLAPLDPGRRLPHLGAADDLDERLAAVEMVRSTLEKARELGIALAALELGEVRLRAKNVELRRAFLRRELGEREPGHRLLSGMLAERRGLSAAVMDACRWSLERVARIAEKLPVTIAVQTGALPWQIPSPREAAALVEEFRGAPIALTLSPGRLAVLDMLGVAGGDERRALVTKHARLVHLTDAVGLDYDLLPGLGEAALSFQAPDGVPIVLSGRHDVSLRELTASRELVASLRAPTADPEAAS